jgi:hypothetical protein
MSDSACALRPDGTLKDVSEIEFFNDVDDDVPMLASSVTSVPAPQPLASSFSQGKLDSFVSRIPPAAIVAGSRRSGRAPKPTEKAREAATRSVPAKRTAPSGTSSVPVRRRVSVVNDTDTEDIFKTEDGENSEDHDLPDLQEESDDEDDNADEVEAAYQRTKDFGDTDRDVVLLLSVYFQ